MIRLFYFLLLLFLSNSIFAIKPKKEYINIPSDFNLNFKEENFITSDSFNIKAWHIIPDENNKKNISIIISYADFGNMSYWLSLSKALSNVGYDVWLYDYRGFGKSDDFHIDANMLYYYEFSNDLKAVVKGVSYQSNNKICLFGFSMGSIISMLYLDRYENTIDFYVGDGHICFPDQILKRLKQPVQLPNNQLNFKNIYQKIKIPFLIFQGSEDAVSTKSDLESLKKYKQDITEICYNGKHLQSFEVLGCNYLLDINCFLLKNH